MNDDDFDHGIQVAGYTVLAAVVVTFAVLVALLVAVARMM